MVKRHTRSGQTEPSHFLSTAEGRGYGRLGPHRYSATGQSRTQEMSCSQVIALFPLETFRSPEGNEAAVRGPISPPLPPYPHHNSLCAVRCITPKQGEGVGRRRLGAWGPVRQLRGVPVLSCLDRRARPRA